MILLFPDEETCDYGKTTQKCCTYCSSCTDLVTEVYEKEEGVLLYRYNIIYSQFEVVLA